MIILGAKYLTRFKLGTEFDPDAPTTHEQATVMAMKNCFGMDVYLVETETMAGLATTPGWAMLCPNNQVVSLYSVNPIMKNHPDWDRDDFIRKMGYAAHMELPECS